MTGHGGRLISATTDNIKVLKLPRSLRKGAKPAALLGMALGALALGLWLGSFPAKAGAAGGAPPDPLLLSAGLAVFAFGGLWWGEVIASDPDRDRPALSAALLLGALLDLAAAKLAGPGPEGSRLFSLWSLPAVLLWSAACPALSSAAFPDGRGQSQGLFKAAGGALAFLALGVMAGLSGALGPRGLGPRTAASLAMIAIALLAWPWHRQSQALANLRLWPSYTLGIFKGKVYGQDLVVSARLAKTVVPASFLGTAAAAMALSPALFGESQSGDFWRLLPSRLLLAAFGAIILGPILARLASPVNALGWALALLALGIGFGPELASSRAAALAGPESPLWGQAPALAPLGAVWPLAARVQVARSDQVAPAIGRLDLWLVLGAAGGFSAAGLLALEGGSPGFWPSVAAWTGALLAMAPTLGWAAAIMLWILANAAVAYF